MSCRTEDDELDDFMERARRIESPMLPICFHPGGSDVELLQSQDRPQLIEEVMIWKEKYKRGREREEKMLSLLKRAGIDTSEFDGACV
jgi:hypothetical protein